MKTKNIKIHKAIDFKGKVIQVSIQCTDTKHNNIYEITEDTSINFVENYRKTHQEKRRKFPSILDLDEKLDDLVMYCVMQIENSESMKKEMFEK